MSELEFAAETDKGTTRRDNQDRWYADTERGLFLVADGMGGGPGGKLAADIVVEVLPRLIRQRLNGSVGLAEPGAARHVVKAMAELSDHLYRESQRRYAIRGIGSTVVLAWIQHGQALVVHLGDSRAYLLHERRLALLTRDHSLLQTLLETGALRPEEAPQHPSQAQLTRFVGMEGGASPESTLVSLSAGDRLLLCSDGLHGALDHKQLTAILRGKKPSEAICRALVAAANRSSGADNVTALVITVGEAR
jgi:PPM family protein phosphatase